MGEINRKFVVGKWEEITPKRTQFEFILETDWAELDGIPVVRSRTCITVAQFGQYRSGLFVRSYTKTLADVDAPWKESEYPLGTFNLRKEEWEHLLRVMQEATPEVGRLG